MTRLAALSFTGSALVAVMAITACAARPPTVDADARQVSIEGRAYALSALTAGTWTATPAGATSVASRVTGAHQAALVKAIETASGCQVTDSNVSPNGRQLDAQVVCAGAPAD